MPPTSVTIYSFDPETSTETPVSDNGVIIMKEGTEGGFGCKADMQDYTGTEPVISLMLGDQAVRYLHINN